jgi:hypothetical protein
MRELQHAVQNHKPLVLVREIDSKHGALALDEARAECPAAIRTAVFGDASWDEPADGGGVLDCRAPPTRVVEWHRTRELQRISLIEIVRSLVEDPKRAARLYVPGGIVDRLASASLHAIGRYSHHLYGAHQPRTRRPSLALFASPSSPRLVDRSEPAALWILLPLPERRDRRCIGCISLASTTRGRRAVTFSSK